VAGVVVAVELVRLAVRSEDLVAAIQTALGSAPSALTV